MTFDIDLLRLASRQYFYKPLAAFFNAFHLRAYLASGVHLDEPALDVGCYDGSFGVLLTDAFGTRPRMFGIEVNRDALKRAGPEARRRYGGMINASATDLPFVDRSFRTVMFNASLFAIDPGLGDALREARRVLVPDGQLCLTVNTDLYARHCWLTRFFHHIGRPDWAQRYSRALDRRLIVRHSFTAEQWRALLEDHGWVVKQCFGFFSPRLTTYWSYLAWTPWRVFGAAQLLPGGALRALLSRIYVAVFRKRYRCSRVMMDPRESTYIWVRAIRKPESRHQLRGKPSLIRSESQSAAGAASGGHLRAAENTILR
ncbi:MAG: class I SAM-dependent methyltransferase [Candidatus Erginobacter occultus]|nr:class I SAM-dependent methyltransferase [Candidatus Erginobacter occultus]